MMTVKFKNFILKVNIKNKNNILLIQGQDLYFYNIKLNICLKYFNYKIHINLFEMYLI